MEIYGNILSPFVSRVMLAARFKGLKYTNLAPKDGLKSPAFLKINPLGKVPALVDGPLKLFESSVIVEYLDAKSKSKPLVPKAPKAAMKVRLAAAVFAEYIQAPCLKLFQQRDPATRNQAAVDAILAEVAKGLDVAEGLMGAPFAAGKFSLADCYALPALFFVEALLPGFGVADPIGGRPKLTAYKARLEKDKLTGGVLAEMTEGLKAFRAAQAAR